MQTLGDVVTAGLILAALIVVPYKLAKAWLWPYLRPVIMSRLASAPPQKTDIEAVFIPVSDTSIEDETDWQMPRISAYLSDDEFVVFLSRQKLRDGKYRLSANDVYKVTGGNRNEVLKIVSQVRATPDFSHRTPEQEQQRTELGIAKR
mgnify:FL=1